MMVRPVTGGQKVTMSWHSSLGLQKIHHALLYIHVSLLYKGINIRIVQVLLRFYYFHATPVQEILHFDFMVYNKSSVYK
jgi:hypothetical protein